MLLWKRPARLKLPPNLERAMEDADYAINARALLPGNRVSLLNDGDEAYPAMLDAIRGAEEAVALEVYIYRTDRVGREFGDALMERARAGVVVRFLFDAVGSFSVDDAYLATLAKAGVQCVSYRPIAPWRPRWGLNQRDHRKILVVDGKVGFVGGINISTEYVSLEKGGAGWHDVHARVEGPAVAELARLFRRTWIRAGGRPYPRTEEPAEEVVATRGTALALALGNEERKRRAGIRRAYLHAIRRARASIRIASAYFIPDRGFRRVLENAVARGVEVSILVPGHSDLKSTQFASQHLFTHLLKAGIRILRWPARMMHAKTVIIDGVWASVGSYNLDARSLFHNLEVVLMVVDRGFGALLEQRFDEDSRRCIAVELASWKKRPFWQKIIEWFWFQFRHWL